MFEKFSPGYPESRSTRVKIIPGRPMEILPRGTRDRIIIQHEGRAAPSLAPNQLIIPGKWAFSIERNDLDYRVETRKGWRRVYGKKFSTRRDGMGRSRIKIAPEASDAKGFAMKINQAARVSGQEEGASRVNKTRPLTTRPSLRIGSLIKNR